MAGPDRTSPLFAAILWAVLLFFDTRAAMAQGDKRGVGYVPPPRTVADITAILDQQKPDPELLAKLRAKADATAPAGADRVALARFYYNRGHARADLGRHRDATADAQRAVDHAEGQLETNEFAQLLHFLGYQHLREGNPKKAVEVFLRVAGNAEREGKTGYLFHAYRMMNHILIVMGDFDQAESYVRRAQARLEGALKEPDQRYRVGWEHLVEL